MKFCRTCSQSHVFSHTHTHTQKRRSYFQTQFFYFKYLLHKKTLCMLFVAHEMAFHLVSKYNIGKLQLGQKSVIYMWVKSFNVLKFFQLVCFLHSSLMSLGVDILMHNTSTCIWYKTQSYMYMLLWSVVAERSSLPDSSSGVSSRMWVRIPAVTLVSLSKTLNHNCFSPPRG